MDRQQYLYENEEEFQQSGAGWWIHKIGIVVYVIVIVAFAVQTLDLVNWLFPADNQFMKVVTVFVADGCALGWAMTEMFYRFRLRRSKHLAFGMWVVTFILSTAATVIQMYLSSTHNIPHSIDPGIITVAYGLVILAFVVNIIAITVIIRMEHEAGQPQRVYLDDLRSRKRALPQPQVRIVEQSTPASMPAQAASPEAIIDPHGVKPQVDAEKKDVNGEKRGGFRAWVDKNIFKDDEPIVEERNGEVRTRRVGGDPQMEAKEEEEIAIQRRAVRQMEEKNRPGLPIDPRKWTKKHWMIAKELMNEDEYNELFNEYLGDQPSEEDLRDDKQTRRLDENPQ
jgi:hypothetical protein